jgi:hypothetical protein
MSSNSGFLDEQGMIDLARKSIEVLRQKGASPTELRRLELLLKDGNVGEAFIMSSLLRTISARFHQKHLRRNCCSSTGDWKTSANLWWNSAEIFSILMRGSIIATPDTILLSYTVSKHWEFRLRRFKD